VGERQDVIALLRKRSVSHGEFLLASGRKSAYYIDARRATMSAEGQAVLGPAGLNAIRAAGWAPASVGGLTMGADPVAYAIARASIEAPPTIDAFSVRKNPKAHGTGRRIEGVFEPGTPVVLIEDVITTGGSALKAAEALRGEGAVILGILAVVDREEGGRQRLEGKGYAVVVLTTTTDLLHEAEV